MKRRKLLRHLQDHGCTQLREGGGHTIFINAQGLCSAVPRHREIEPALVRKICKQLKVPAPPGR